MATQGLRMGVSQTIGNHLQIILIRTREVDGFRMDKQSTEGIGPPNHGEGLGGNLWRDRYL